MCIRDRIPALLAGLALGGALLLSTVGVAAAVTPPAGPAGKGVCATQAVAMKTGATVDALSAKISASKVLTTSDAAALQSEIASTKTGLTSLKTSIDSETSLPALKVDSAKIAADYRVYPVSYTHLRAH